jgi:hypothetical protein
MLRWLHVQVARALLRVLLRSVNVTEKISP